LTKSAGTQNAQLERAYTAGFYHYATTAERLDPATTVAKAAAAKAPWYNQRRAYRQLCHQKCTDFWRSKLEANSSNARQLWRLVDELLGRGRVPESSAIDVEAFSQSFAEKVASIRLNTSDAPPASFNHVCDLARLCSASRR